MWKKTLMVALDYREEYYEYLNEAVDGNEPGIILKQPLAVYKPNWLSFGRLVEFKSE